MWRCVVGFAVIYALCACNQVFGIPDVTQGSLEHRVGGRVHGLWDGADGVALRLQADGVDARLTVSTNGTFSFEQQLATGASYTVTVATSPVQHTCVVAGGGNGIVAEVDAASISIACTGPAVSIALSAPWVWTFDATENEQQLTGSIVLQDVALTVSGDRVNSVTVNGTSERLGEPTAPIALALGSAAVPVALTASGGLSKTYQLIFNRGASVIEQVVYGKASNPDGGDQFGYSVSLSGDTLAVAAYAESSNATGVNGDQANNNGSGSGAVYVFVRSGPTWAQQAYLKASNTEGGDGFGYSVSLSGDTLAVAAYAESSNATGVNGDQANNNATGSGAVYVFVRTGTAWVQQAYLKASNTGSGDFFGSAVSLSGDTLAVGAYRESSATTGVNNDQNDNSASEAGAVYVFVRGGTRWTQQAYLKASNTGAGDQFGYSVSLNGDTLAVGAFGESSAAIGVDGNQADDSTSRSGAVYVFVRNGTTWTQQAYLKASNTGTSDFFGISVSLSGDSLAIGAYNEASAATGVNGDQTDNSVPQSGAVYIFVRTGATWTQQAYLKASTTGIGDRFGCSVSLTGDTLAVGAYFEDGAAIGVNGNQSDNTAGESGAAYVFARDGATWMQKAYLKASNTSAQDVFGYSVSMSGDALVVGAYEESSAAAGINGNQADNSAQAAGAIYVFR